ncbi:MAG: flagellar filament capping protein FliD [Bdellovibrionales bacterium]|nr:flagellar filament capping protein FliD [Bdellovibrionales bacterium]
MFEVPELASGNPQLQKAMNKLVQVEEKGIQKLDAKKAAFDNKLKLVKDLKTKATEARDAVTPFKTPQDFRELVGTSSDPSILNVTAVDKSKAQTGNYDIEVVQLANTNTISTFGFPDKDRSRVGVGYITFDTQDGSKDVYISSDNNTLEGVANAINSAKVGVRALVVNDGSDADEPYRLVITGEKSGWKNEINWPDFNLLDGDMDFDIDRNREAQSAIIKINGEPIMVDDNKVKELLPGVTFDLKKAQVGQVVKMEIKPDYEKIEGKAKSMVDKLNAVLTFIQNQNQLDSNSRKDPSKALGGDSVLQSLESQLRTTIQRTQGSLDDTTIRQLNDLGISFSRTGTLTYDGKKFQSQLENHFDEVSAFFTGDNSALGGLANSLANLMDGVVRRGDGMATIKEEGLQKQIDRLAKEQEKKTEAAQARIDRAKSQFARVESAIQQMQNQNAGGGVASLIPGR